MRTLALATALLASFAPAASAGPLDTPTAYCTAVRLPAPSNEHAVTGVATLPAGTLSGGFSCSLVTPGWTLTAEGVGAGNVYVAATTGWMPTGAWRICSHVWWTNNDGSVASATHCS